MAADDPAKILVQPGRLIWGATDLTAAYPYGGTELGLTRDGVRLTIQQATRDIVAEETGVAIQETIYLGSNVRIEASLYQWDDDALQRVFHNTDTGGTVSEKVIEIPGDAYNPGSKLSAKAGVLVFSPTDTTNNKVILLRKAIPMSPASIGIDFSVGKDSILPVVFVGLPDLTIGTGDANYPTRTGAVGNIQNLTI